MMLLQFDEFLNKFEQIWNKFKANVKQIIAKDLNTILGHSDKDRIGF